MIIGLALFGVTLLFIDREATLRESRRLGLLLPLVLLPSGAWHALRTLGWLICFPARRAAHLLAALPRAPRR